MKIKNKLIDILKCYQPKIDETTLSKDTLIADLGIDSLDFIEFIFDIESTFGFELSDEKLGE